MREFNIVLRYPQGFAQDTGIVLTQNDSNAYRFNIEIWDGINGINYNDIDSATITFAKRDKTVVQGNMQVTSDKLTYQLGTNEIACPGKVLASVQLLDNNARLTTAKFVFSVESDLITEEMIESTTEFAALQQLQQELEAIDVVDLTNEFNAHKADNMTVMKEIKSNPTNYNGAIVTFLDDDCDPTVKTIWLPIIADHDFKMTFAVVTGRVGGANSLTLQELKELQEQGHDIVSHTVNHHSTRSTDPAILDEEFKNSQKWLKDNGFNGYDVLVYPGGIDPPLDYIYVKDIARKYYKYGVATLGTYNALPVDNWALQRPNIDVLSLEQLKSHVDAAVENNGWLIFLSHAYELNKDMVNNVAKINDLIEYIKGLGIPIMSFKEAEKIKGNVIAIGEHTQDNATFVSTNGTGKIGGSLIVRISAPSDYDMDSDITNYPRNTKTIQPISSVADTFLGVGGIMEVYRGYHDSYSYATFLPLNSNQVYIRKYRWAFNEWYSWEPLTKVHETGFWTPVLVGSTTAGTHIYKEQQGSWTKIGNMVTVHFSIRIEAANFDTNMAGLVRISGLPFTSVSNMRGRAYAPVEYNNLNLGTNYYNAFIGIGSNMDYINLYRSGVGVATDYLPVSTIPAGQPVIFRGQLTYQIS